MDLKKKKKKKKKYNGAASGSIGIVMNSGDFQNLVSTSCNRIHAEKWGLLASKSCSIPPCTRDETLSTRACAIQCSAAYPERGKLLQSLSADSDPSSLSPEDSRVPRQACARRVCASSGEICRWETSPPDVASRYEVRNSFTEKCENCTTRE